MKLNKHPLKIEDHLLKGSHVTHVRCDKKLTKMKQEINTIVIHYTAGGSAMSSAQHLAASETDVCAHVVIERTGEIIQICQLDLKCPHCGPSEYKGMINLNNNSIGIELANAGDLHPDKSGNYRTWFNSKCNNVYTHIENGKKTYWEAFPEEQIFTLVNVIKAIKENYPIEYIVGHTDITSRKKDPGPAFPFERVMDMVNE